MLANKNLTMHNVCEYVDMLHRLQVGEKNDDDEDVPMSNINHDSNEEAPDF